MEMFCSTAGEQYDEEGKIIVDANGNPVKRRALM